MENGNNINIYIINIAEERTIVKNVNVVSMNERLLEIFQRVNGVGLNITFNSYYIFDFELFLNECKLPYIIRNESIEWNVDINTVTLLDFMITHDIALSDGITIEIGYPMAGGRGNMLDVVEIWVNTFPIIKEFAPYFITSVGFLSSSISLIHWINNLKNKKKNDIPYPYHFFDYIYKRSIWNHYELSRYLDISIEDTKHWLNALLYQWDNSIKAYVVSEEDKNKVMNMINRVNRYPCL